MQQMQEHMNSMNHSGDSQDVESNHSGRLSHDSSQSLHPQPRQKIAAWHMESIWIAGKRFLEINFLRLIHPEIILKEFNLTTCERNWEAVPEAGRTKTIHTSEDRLNEGTIPMPTFATKPLTTSSTMPVELPQNYMVGQQRQQISELQFEKFRNPQSFLVWKIRVKNHMTTCLDFHRMLCYGSN